jgi:hypothetical protein
VDTAARRALAVSSDRATRAHLEDVRDQIARILDPKFATPAAPASGGGQGPPGSPGLDDWDIVDDRCWPDYAIRGQQR